jgi:hypothetical protein
MAVIALVVAALGMVINILTFLLQVSLRMTPSTPPSYLDWPVSAKVWVGFWLGVTLFYAVLACQQLLAKRKAPKSQRSWLATTEP